MRRRELLQRVTMLTGVALAPSLASALMAEAPRTANPPINEAQRKLVGLLAEHIIPATDTPGALAAGVDHTIGRLIEGYLTEADADAYRAGLEALDSIALGLGADRFAKLSHEEQRRLLSELDARAFSGDAAPLAEFWRRHKALTVMGYYTSEIGATQELRVMPMGDYDADVPYAQIGRGWS